MSETVSPVSATIRPKVPAATSSAACAPKRVASERSKAMGVPPRWTWPSTTERASPPSSASMASASRSPTPAFASRVWPNSSTSPSWAPGSSSTPSLTTTMAYPLPRSRRPRMRAQIASSEAGTSGMRITWAPPASPDSRAIQPAWRPITSTTITRSCDSAVVWRRSMASVAICTAVQKPKV